MNPNSKIWWNIFGPLSVPFNAPIKFYRSKWNISIQMDSIWLQSRNEPVCIWFIRVCGPGTETCCKGYSSLCNWLKVIQRVRFLMASRYSLASSNLLASIKSSTSLKMIPGCSWSICINLASIKEIARDKLPNDSKTERIGSKANRQVNLDPEIVRIIPKRLHCNLKKLKLSISVYELLNKFRISFNVECSMPTFTNAFKFIK